MVNTNDIITIVLSSSLLVGIISAGVTFVVNKRNNDLKYVIEERKIWRQELRNIVDELETTRMGDRQKILQKLKVRINPYGEKDGSIMRDSHIWEIIHELEEVKSITDYNMKKKRLVMYISLLLKYDWERTKKEVKGDKDRKGLLITFIFGTGYLIYKHFIEYGLEYNVVFLCALFVFLFLPVVIGSGLAKNIFFEEWNKTRRRGFKIISKILIVLCTFIVGIGTIVVLPIEVLAAYNFDIVNTIEGQGYLDLTIVLLVFFLLCIFANNSAIDDIDKNYTDAINEYQNKEDTNH